MTFSRVTYFALASLFLANLFQVDNAGAAMLDEFCLDGKGTKHLLIDITT